MTSSKQIKKCFDFNQNKSKNVSENQNKSKNVLVFVNKSKNVSECVNKPAATITTLLMFKLCLSIIRVF